MRLLKIICVSMILLACSQPHKPYVHEDLKEWFIHFERQIETSTNGVSGYFDESVPYALCVFSDLSVRINPVKWKAAPYNERESIIFHELGHCAKGLTHDNSLSAVACPLSIMNEYSFWDTYCYVDYKFELFEELRNK